MGWVACELSQCSWVFRGREEWSWHQACWDGAVKPRILNTSWPWSLGRHLSMSCHCFCHLTVPPTPFHGSSFMDGQGQQLPRLWGSPASCCLNSNSLQEGGDGEVGPVGRELCDVASAHTGVLPGAYIIFLWPLWQINLQPAGLEQQTRILAQFWRPEVRNQFHWSQSKVLAGPHSFLRL